MPPRTAQPGFEHTDLFHKYCLTHNVEGAADNYRSHMNTMARAIAERIGPEILRGESDVIAILDRIRLPRYNRGHMINFRSVLRKYAEMVRSNYEGAFDAITPVAIDVEEHELPSRIRTEISRIVRDTATARALKRLYKGQCQLCGERLEISPGEFYLEAHHLKPLGQRHNGPDVKGNLICVCPNCHVLLDFNARPIRHKNLKISQHIIGEEFINYHNEHCR